MYLSNIRKKNSISMPICPTNIKKRGCWAYLIDYSKR